MSDARTALERYAERNSHSAPGFKKALRAVLALHMSDRGSGPDPGGRCFECAEIYPCPTVTAIQTALGDTTP